MTNRQKAAAAVLLLMGMIVPQRLEAATGTLAPAPYLTVLTSSGAPISGACVWTYTAGTSTPVATYTDKTITVANSNPIITDASGQYVAYLVPGLSYKFVVETACTPPAHGSVLRTQDGIDAVPASAAALEVTGTAGEALTAGQCAYLSDGSGAKAAGQWFKCDSANTYSSTLPEVAIVPSSIASAASGTFRLAGATTGLVGLTIGQEYFVGSAGAITATAPTNKRHIGHADSVTSLVLTADPPVPPTVAYADGFRISLTTATCITTADVTGASAVTLFLTPCTGNRLTLFNSAGIPETCTTAEVSIAVPATTSTMYDVWAYDSTFGTCTVTLELLQWTNDTTRATAIALATVGAYTKSGDLTRRYLGSFRTTTVSGQTEDSFAKRYVWNFYNRAPRIMRVTVTTDSWNQVDATIRQANATATNQLDFVIGVADVGVEAQVIGSASSNLANSVFMVGIGEDSTTVFDAGCLIGPQSGFNAGTPMVTTAQLRKYTAVGRHVWVWLEKGQNAVTTVWYGDNGSNGTQSGIHGLIAG